ncbi:SWIB/MDM2 domain,SWIB domain,DEK, C-terminal [Cinara cedri]|uniref:SWIB/MDM2 domain,SWIB domain,DEK, C-terminal n=2 Tax=Cinara cedri TaxID=506608 RepID=A0A5E4N6M5_9HEMI|nr:SWIB/MDM2 domain,SWIB domain,DEK, C-terminal [Cinara cedri]
MSDVSKETLKKEIAALLKGADLSKTSAKKIRQELEKKLDADLDDRKKEIDALVMEGIKKAKATKKNGKGDSDDDNDDDEDDAENDDDDEEDEEEEVKPAKKAAPPKRKKADSSDESAGSDDDDGDKNDGDYSPKKGTPSKKKAPAAKRGRKKKDDSDSDEEWKSAKKGAKKAGGAKRGANSGYTKSITLSPELASLMGTEALPRHEVVKKMWAIIKERNLYDPTNKQYAICDDDLMKVIGVKRFRTFGMMKFLKNHFIS